MSEIDESPERVADYFVVVGLDSAIVSLQVALTHYMSTYIHVSLTG